MRPRLGIAIEAGRVHAAAVRRGRTLWAAEAPYADADDLAQVLAGLAAERPRGVRAATVALAAGVARVKRVAGLPRLARADLAQHVQLFSRRYFLQNGVPLVTDARPDREAALLAAAPAPLVEAISRGLAAAGLRCTAIGPAQLLPSNGNGAQAPDGRLVAVAAATAQGFALSLMPESLRRQSAAAVRHTQRRWTVAAAASVLLAALTCVAALAQRERVAARELARLGAAVDAALAVRRDLDATTAALAALEERRAAGRSGTVLLARLAQVLPDSAFVAAVRIEPGGTTRITGYATSAARVLARVERLDGVGAAIEGPVTREVVSGREWERFTIRLDPSP